MDLFCCEMFIFLGEFMPFKLRKFVLIFLIENRKMLSGDFKLLDFGI